MYRTPDEKDLCKISCIDIRNELMGFFAVAASAHTFIRNFLSTTQSIAMWNYLILFACAL